jgi:hypothetical protein
LRAHYGDRCDFLLLVVTKAQLQPFYSVGFKDAETPAPGVVSMVASRLKVSG